MPVTATLPPPDGTTEFSVTGMTCNGCARHVTEAIQSVSGVATATVSLDAGRARVRWSPQAAPDADAVLKAITGAGFGAAPITEESCHTDKPGWSPLAGWRFNVVFGSVATGALMLGEWAFGLGMERWFHWAAFAIALPVQILCGARFYRGAWNQLKIGSSNMDTLVALGSTTAFAYSAWGLFAGWHAHLYFMEAAAIITLISVGHWLETLMSARAAGAMRALLDLAPATARRLDDQGKELETPVAELRAGDRVALRPGDRVPVDGEVIDGASAVDESMLTGESVPVDKRAGANVYGGTANQDGWLVLRVTATGEATALAQIIAVVERAQNSRADIQKLGDRVSSVFVPVVIAIALATALWWGLAPESARRVHDFFAPFLWHGWVPEAALAAAVIQAAAVLIVACPCAMGLATPVAIMAGTNAAARRGILIRDGAALEKSGRITAVLFDKTGTLTQGKLVVTAVADLRPENARATNLPQLAAALARPSSHPLSQAIALGVHPSGCPDDGAPQPDTLKRGHLTETASIALMDWKELRGLGVQARAGDTVLRLGSLTWLRECGVEPGAGSAFVEQWSPRGATLLGLAEGTRLLGLFALRDELKPGARDVVERLRRAGQHVYLISGDGRATANAIGAQAGIAPDNIFAEVRPERKADIVRDLQQRGERVAFVGDGINDAPALEQADLGIAVARASDVAREAADLILLKSDIHAIPEALGLAQATLRTIKQNLFWAFFYNAAAVPLAALGFLNPVLCAAAMGLSDVVVIGNALRLRRWR